jgi:energy-coupling factor transporter ATP-binding protein EcfA2
MSDFTPHEAPIHEAARLPVPVPARLVGRDAALAQIYTQLKENHPVLLHGPLGVGKSALAATLASAYAQQPGGVLWLSVNDPRLDELLVRIGRAYQISEIGTTENPLSMIGAVENVLRSNKPLIVLDGAINADVVSRFISRCAHDLPLLIVSERRLEGTWAALEIKPLEHDDAVALFVQESRLSPGDHQEDLGTLVDLLDHMPFGIVISARSMAANKQSPEELVEAMRPAAQAAGDNKSLVGLTVAFRHSLRVGPVHSY